jgi:predicted MPP superfamily phosphohydrolase
MGNGLNPKIPPPKEDQSARAKKSRWLLWSELGTLLFIAADCVLLAALPRLGLSFGPIWPPVIWLIFPRLVFLAVAFLPPAIRRIRRRAVAPHAERTAFLIWLVLSLVLATVEVDALYIEPFHLTETELQLPGPAFAAGRPLRIVQLSDLHIEGITQREREMIARVDALAPDLIVLTGDYVHLDRLNSPGALKDTRSILSELHAPLGVFAVQGTVDRENVLAEIFAGLPVTLLRNEVYRVPLAQGNLYLLGLDFSTGKHNPEILTRLMASLPSDAYTILLYHTPDLIREAADAGIDLYLAGHTHGGQIRLPFYGALVTFSKYGKQYEMGLYHVESTYLYVTRGIGMEGLGLPRVRFLCPPEIVVIELSPNRGK